MKIKIEDIEAALRANLVAPATIIKIVNEIEAKAEENKPDTNPDSKTKNEFVVLQDPNSPSGAYVVQIPEGEDAGQIVAKLSKGAKDFNNTTRKGRKNPLNGWTDVFGNLPRKFTKAENVQIKTKELVQVITLPTKP